MSIRQINITAEQPPIDLYIGRVAENEVTGVEFDLTPWIQTYGEGAATIVMKRWGDTDPYPIALEIDENGKAVWMFSAADLAKPGYAYAQLSFETATEKRKKSPIYTLKIGKSLTATGEQPDPYDSWLEALQHLAAKAMAEALDIEDIATDDTLSIEGGIADGKATGDALALKADKSTTYTKAEVDQMIEDVEVETDTTLSVSGAPADAKKTGDELSALKADLGDAIGYGEQEKIGAFTSSRFWSNESTIAEIKSASGYQAFDPIDVNVGDRFSAHLWQGTSSKQDMLLIVDENYTILKNYRGTTSQYNDAIIDIQETGAKYALITSQGGTPHFPSFKLVKLNNLGDTISRVDEIETDISDINKKSIISGKYVSILGDSISALTGTLPTGNEAYYTGSNYGITSADDMWWKIVADKLGMNVLVNNSWSGSQVCDRTPGTKIPASYPSRCQALHDSNHNPDYVLIAMGVNDYSYNSLLGDWDGQTMPIDDTDFTQSYALMINRIKSAYPNAKIICISPWFVQRGTDTGIAYVNTQTAHLTESAYGNAIKKLCDMLNATYIDSYVGFNRYNYYPTYCEDSSETPTHPNKAGQSVMGNVIAEKIRTLII